MDRIRKALKKLSPRERNKIKKILTQLKSGTFKNLDIRKLKGRQDIFRARKGNIRIIYQVKNKNIFILAIERRSNRTYNRTYK